MKFALNQGLLNQRLIAKGLSPAEADALLKKVSIDTLQINKQGQAAKSNGGAAFSKAFAMAFLLTMPILLYGLNMARSVIEEKSSRMFEVMLAVARPDDLLAGKLLGVGAVGLTQIAIWVMAAVLIAGSALAAPLLSGSFAIHFSLAEAVLLSRLLRAGILSLQCVLFRPGGDLRDCAGAADVHAAGGVPVWISFGIIPYLLNNPEFGLVDCRIALSAHGAFCHGSAHGTRRLRPHGSLRLRSAFLSSQHLGRSVVLIAPLSRRHSDVWQARYASRDVALASLQLSRVECRRRAEPKAIWIETALP